MDFSTVFSLVLIGVSFLSFLMYAAQNSFKGYLAFSIIVFVLADIWIADAIGFIGVVILSVLYGIVLFLLWTKYRTKLFEWWSSISGFQTDMSDVNIGDSASTITSLKMDGSLKYKGQKYYAKTSGIGIPANYSVTIERIEGYYLIVRPN
ncbi:MAG: NfeD family protein [Bacteroidota bacterium]|jgi:membrane protein implicated in regulation of membrane protease activity